MTSWLLWHHLLYPTSHPLHRRILREPVFGLNPSRLVWLLLFCVFVTVLSIGALSVQLLFEAAAPFLILAIVFNSSFIIVMRIAGISITITETRENGIYDAICVTPSGALGTIWAITTGKLHHHDLLLSLVQIHRVIVSLYALILSIVVTTTVLRLGIANLTDFVRLLLDILAIGIASCFDLVQSVVLGSLIAMLWPFYFTERSTVYVWAVLTFVVFQLLTAIMTLLAFTIVIPSVHQFLSIADWIAEISTPILTLLAFYGIRESIITILWRILTYWLNASSSELGR